MKLSYHSLNTIRRENVNFQTSVLKIGLKKMLTHNDIWETVFCKFLFWEAFPSKNFICTIPVLTGGGFLPLVVLINIFLFNLTPTAHSLPDEKSDNATIGLRYIWCERGVNWSNYYLSEVSPRPSEGHPFADIRRHIAVVLPMSNGRQLCTVGFWFKRLQMIVFASGDVCVTWRVCCKVRTA